MTAHTLRDLAELLDARLVGDEALEITGVAGVREARSGDITFLVNPRYESYLVLREELAEFLAGHGVYRDVIFFDDLLAAQVYAGYIHEQGGSYLRADFANAEEPMMHIRRLLGLDGITADGRLRVKAADGTAIVVDELDPGPSPRSGARGDEVR